jgi:hypothetical protein
VLRCGESMGVNVGDGRRSARQREVARDAARRGIGAAEAARARGRPGDAVLRARAACRAWHGRREKADGGLAS